LTGYLLRRALRAGLTIVAISLVVFALARLSGDPTSVLVPPEASAAQRAAIRTELGLDRPWPAQYVTFAGHALRGDFGESFRFHTSASELFWRRFPATLELAATASLLALLGGVAAGVASATWAGRAAGHALGVLFAFGQAVPSFVVALLLVTLFSVQLGWLPAAGKSGVSSFVLPSVSLALFSFAAIARLVRAATLEALRADFVRTARMKGLPERLVVVRHVLPHAIGPVASVFSLHLAFFLGGSVVIETIFAWPGICQLTVQSILTRDYALVQAIVFFSAVTVVLIGMVLDGVLFAWDPRSRTP
jgi:peptide/nickel transport system permease protein